MGDGFYPDIALYLHRPWINIEIYLSEYDTIIKFVKK